MNFSKISNNNKQEKEEQHKEEFIFLKQQNCTKQLISQQF